MGTSAPTNALASQGIGCDPCLYSPKCEESFLEHEQSMYCAEKIVKANFLEDPEISSIAEEDDLNNLVVNELGTLLCQTLHFDDAVEPLCVSNLTLNQDEICSDEEVQPLYLDKNMLEGMHKCVAVLGSKVIESYPLAYDAGEDFPSTLHNEYFSETKTPVFLDPLPTAQKLVSALKGGRAQHGKPPSPKLSVKWAPEVYDPLPTSSSHTVKGYRHHRLKAKKDHYRLQKLIKSKSSRGGTAERKYAHRRSSSSTIDPRILRLQALSKNRLPPLSNSGHSNMEPALDYMVRKQESKCGSCFYIESPAQVHLPVAEAS